MKNNDEPDWAKDFISDVDLVDKKPFPHEKADQLMAEALVEINRIYTTGSVIFEEWLKEYAPEEKIKIERIEVVVTETRNDEDWNGHVLAVTEMKEAYILIFSRYREWDAARRGQGDLLIVDENLKEAN